MSRGDVQMSVAATTARVMVPILVALGTIVTTSALALADPNNHTLVICPLRALTGWACPLCGGLRATSDLAHGDVAGALAMNPLWVVTIPALVVAWALWLRRSSRGHRARPVPMAGWLALVGVILAFGVLRNLPFLTAWLGPVS